MSNEISQLKVNGAYYDIADKTARKRLDDVEYQTVTTDTTYEHKELPEGEKSVTINSDGTWGDTAYICTGEDLIPRDGVNKTIEGVAIEKTGFVYHITGTGSYSPVFAYADGSIRNYSVGQLNGQTLKLVTFAKKVLGSNIRVCIQFFDETGTSLAGQIKKTIASKTTSEVAEIVVPEGTSYMTVGLILSANIAFDEEIQIYLSLADSFQTVSSLENTVTESNAIISLPYPSIVSSKMSLSDYINYVAENRIVTPDIEIPDISGSVTYLTPEDFGAVGDGKTDDSEAIALCLAKATSKQIVLMAKRYYVTTPITIGSGLNIIANRIIYEGSDTAIKIIGKRNTLKIHSINSTAVGISFESADSVIFYNNVEITELVSQSHGIIFVPNVGSIWQNTIRFSHIQAGGSGCYAIAYLHDESSGFVAENNFYGGHINNCEWAVYKCTGNSRFYGLQIEGDVQGGFYVEKGCQIFHPRIAESQRDGNLPIYKFIIPAHTTIYDSSGIYINQIDLSEAKEIDDDKGYPITEHALGTINGRVICSNITDGAGAGAGIIYSTKTYIWGKYLIFTPFMAYKKVVTTDTLDTRLVGSETSFSEIKSLSQLPTKFVVNNINTEIYLHASYCAFGFNEFEVEQANGNTCKVYDVKGTLLFDGTEMGDGLYKFKVYKDAAYCVNKSGTLRYDFLGHYWQVLKLGATVIS
jgi:hypothetical protein